MSLEDLARRAREADPSWIEIRTDPLKRRMTGITAHGNIPFDVPYISQITDTLFVGGCTDELVLPDNIKHLISLYPWESYEGNSNVLSVMSVVMYDSHPVPDPAQLESIAAWVNVCRSKEPTLVHCQAGLNRSNLIAALALIRGPEKFKPKTAIELLRYKRSPAVLCNVHFENWLLNLKTEVDVGESL